MIQTHSCTSALSGNCRPKLPIENCVNSLLLFPRILIHPPHHLFLHLVGVIRRHLRSISHSSHFFVLQLFHSSSTYTTVTLSPFTAKPYCSRVLPSSQWPFWLLLMPSHGMSFPSTDLFLCIGPIQRDGSFGALPRISLHPYTTFHSPHSSWARFEIDTAILVGSFLSV